MDAFDSTYAIHSDMQGLLGRNLELRMFKDSNQLFNAITIGKRAAEKHLAIDIIAERHAYLDFEIHCIELVRRLDSPVDALSRPGGNSWLLQIVGCTDNTEVVEWIIRKTHENHGGWGAEASKERRYSLE